MRLIVCATLLLLLATALWSLQRPWRPERAIHIVCNTILNGVDVAVVQQHDDLGLNYSFVAVRPDPQSRWKWYSIGEDDLYWSSAQFRIVDSNTLQVVRGSRLLAAVAFTKSNSITINGSFREAANKETWELK
jgi:hypothetical protein